VTAVIRLVLSDRWPWLGGRSADVLFLGESMSTTEVHFPSETEIEGFWALDKMHAPRPITPLSQDLVMAPLGTGFTRAQTEYDCPVVTSVKAINHYFFVSFHPHPEQAVIDDRMTRYLATLDKKLPLIGKRWTNEWLPMIRTRNEAERDVDYAGMSDAQLDAKLDNMTEWMLEMWYIHGHINFALLSGAALSDMYDAVIKPADPTEAYQILQGHHTRPADASHAIWKLSRTAKHSPVLSAVFDAHPPRELAGALAASDEGRAFLAELKDFLYDFGWRSDAVYDLADVPWREDPSIPLGNIARFINLADSDNPQVNFVRAVKLREELMAKVRGRLADDPDNLATFNTLYEAAQYAYPLTEDHAFYIDQMGIACFRRFVLAIGDRLVEKGAVAKRDDVFLLHRGEVGEALAKGTKMHAVAAARASELAAAAAVTAPGAVGAPPPPPQPGDFVDPFMDALVSRLLGLKPPSGEPENPDMIDGVAGSPGVYTGVARVVRSLDEAGDLEDGEIMVCEMTLPPWVPMFSIAGAVVADVGGVMSHCAIVAREFNIPCVVGSVNGCDRITSGQIITVDGTNGNVYLDGRSL
jgi:rifampicin phosphotransferase